MFPEKLHVIKHPVFPLVSVILWILKCCCVIWNFVVFSVKMLCFVFYVVIPAAVVPVMLFFIILSFEITNVT